MEEAQLTSIELYPVFATRASFYPQLDPRTQKRAGEPELARNLEPATRRML